MYISDNPAWQPCTLVPGAKTLLERLSKVLGPFQSYRGSIWVLLGTEGLISRADPIAFRQRYWLTAAMHKPAKNAISVPSSRSAIMMATVMGRVS
jgi:hypothetical protein